MKGPGRPGSRRRRRSGTAAYPDATVSRSASPASKAVYPDRPLARRHRQAKPLGIRDGSSAIPEHAQAEQPLEDQATDGVGLRADQRLTDKFDSASHG